MKLRVGEDKPTPLSITQTNTECQNKMTDKVKGSNQGSLG